MSNKKLKIIIFDGSFQTTTFNRRLIKGLVFQGHQVYVLGFNLSNPSPVKGVHYVSLGSNQDKLELLTTSLVLQGLNACKVLLKLNKKELQKYYKKYSLMSFTPSGIPSYPGWNLTSKIKLTLLF